MATKAKPRPRAVRPMPLSWTWPQPDLPASVVVQGEPSTNLARSSHERFAIKHQFQVDPTKATQADIRRFLSEAVSLFGREAKNRGLSDRECQRLMICAFDPCHDAADRLWASLKRGMPGDRDEALARDQDEDERTPSVTEVAEQFTRLATEWRAATSLSSCVQEIASHPAYRKIVMMGPPVVPLIIDDLRKAPDHWFPALYELTGATPVAPEHRGRMKAMAADWVRWWDEEHG